MDSFLNNISNEKKYLYDSMWRTYYDEKEFIPSNKLVDKFIDMYYKAVINDFIKYIIKLVINNTTEYFYFNDNDKLSIKLYLYYHPYSKEAIYHSLEENLYSLLCKRLSRYEYCNEIEIFLYRFCNYLFAIDVKDIEDDRRYLITNFIYDHNLNLYFNGINIDKDSRSLEDIMVEFEYLQISKKYGDEYKYINATSKYMIDSNDNTTNNISTKKG